jgi:aldose sugar dehydrogenase
MKTLLNRTVTVKQIFIAAFIVLIFIVGNYVSANYDGLCDRLIKYDFNHLRDRYVHKHMPNHEVKYTTTSIGTTFIDLNVSSLKVPVKRKGDGGALTSFNDELLLITHEGNIFLVTENTIKKTKIAPPENGFEDYKKAARSEKYKNYIHHFHKFRFNDILYYKEGSEQGLVISYTEWLPTKECYVTTIAKLKLPLSIDTIMDFQAARTDWKIVYRTLPCLKLKSTWRAIEGHMAGGRIDYLNNNKIVLGSGDYSWDGVYAPVALAQLADNDYGKVLIIDLNKGIAEKISKGNRNMQGVLVADDGQIWVTEQGPRGGDELNRIVAGKNYGWPAEILGTRYNKLPWPSTSQYGRHDNYTAPVFAWVPSKAISDLTQIKNFHSSWDGDLLAASLRGKTLFRLRIKKNRVVFAEPIPIGLRIRYVHQHTNGRIVLWTDAKYLVFLTPSPITATAVFLEKNIDKTDASPELKNKIKTAINNCNECHAFDVYDNIKAPALGAIFGKEIASTAYANYSKGFQSLSGYWSEDKLANFIYNPNEYAPGTNMPNPEVDDPNVIKGVVDLLKKLKVDAERRDPH